MRGNTWRVSVYSSAKRVLPHGETTIYLELTPSGHLSFGQNVITLDNALIVDTESEDYCLATANTSFTLSGSTTSINSVQSESDAAAANAQTYDLSGRKISDSLSRRASHGVYIINGNKVVK